MIYFKQKETEISGNWAETSVQREQKPNRYSTSIRCDAER
jgi:hypothetical protein